MSPNIITHWHITHIFDFSCSKINHFVQKLEVYGFWFTFSIYLSIVTYRSKVPFSKWKLLNIQTLCINIVFVWNKVEGPLVFEHYSVPRPGHVIKLPVTWGSATVFAGYSGFLHHIQLASHELATGINVTKSKIPNFKTIVFPLNKNIETKCHFLNNNYYKLQTLNSRTLKSTLHDSLCLYGIMLKAHQTPERHNRNSWVVVRSTLRAWASSRDMTNNQIWWLLLPW